MNDSYQKPEEPAGVAFKNHQVYVTGNWTKHYANVGEKQIRKLSYISGRDLIIDLAEVGLLDTVGAMVLRGFFASQKKRWLSVELVGVKPEHQALFDLIEGKEEILSNPPKVPRKESVFTVIGEETYKKYLQLKSYLAFTGQLTVMLFHSIRHFTPLQIRSFLNSIDEMGYRALPIIALLSFLIGVVLAYQLGVQLQTYGANAFIVNLIGQAVLREFGPLITAIIGAGRTSSAITAQLGTMKINEEIDALKTMGFSPFDILVIPRVIASLIAFPLLIVWADIFGVLGGMIMTKAFFGTQYGDFLHRFKDVVDVTTLTVGLSKAPAFALIISVVGCFQGMMVSRNADSVGIQTTKSVVQAIFLIIIADAIYSIIYSKLNI